MCVRHGMEQCRCARNTVENSEKIVYRTEASYTKIAVFKRNCCIKSSGMMRQFLCKNIYTG